MSPIRNTAGSLRFTLFLANFALAVPFAASAADLTADHCQIFIRKVSAAPNSHGSAALRAVVKVNWLGNGEEIHQVGFYGKVDATDLGNQSDCHFGSTGTNGQWSIQNPAGGYSGIPTELGEYAFSFSVATGSVTSECPGYKFASIGSFFVRTNKNTYWLNPSLDRNQNFYFDANGFNSVTRKGGTYQFLYTDREDLRYYNPLGCR